MLVAAHRALGTTLFYLGDGTPLRTRTLQQGMALYDPQQHRAWRSSMGRTLA